MSLVNEQWEFLKDVARLIVKAADIGVVLTGDELYRTRYQQAKHIADGKSLTMKSNHLRRLAVDFNFFIDGQLNYTHERVKELGAFWESLNPNNRWGGNWKFKDNPHFERNIP